MDSKFGYTIFCEAPLEDLRKLLRELKSILERRIALKLDVLTNPKFVKNRGAIDSVYLNDKERREIYINECESIANELNDLGHQLQPLDIDSDTNINNTCISWATDWQSGNARGLDIEFHTKNTVILWVISPNA